MPHRIGCCALAALALCTAQARADGGAEAEAGFGIGRWNAKKSSIEDVRLAIGGHFGIGHNLVMHTGLTADAMFVETTTNNGLLELGPYASMTSSLQSGWSIGPRVAFEIVEKPVLLVGMRVAHDPVTVGIDFVHMWAAEHPTGVVASASLTGKAGAWAIAITGALGLLFIAAARGNG